MSPTIARDQHPGLRTPFSNASGRENLGSLSLVFGDEGEQRPGSRMEGLRKIIEI